MDNVTCSTDGCNEAVVVRGMCKPDYDRWRRAGGTGKVCSIDKCSKPAICRGWCSMHWNRWDRHGDPLFVKRVFNDDVAQFWSHVDKDGPLPEPGTLAYERGITSPCWMWTAAINNMGYGKGRASAVDYYAHIRSYEWFVGPIPNKYDVDHLCRTTACCNPEHLEAVPHQENCMRGLRGRLNPNKL